MSPRQAIRRALYAASYAAGIVTWLAALVAMSATGWLAMACHRLWADAPGGNCWVFVLPKYARRGGYLIVRAADGVRLFGGLQIPHVMWAPTVPADLEVEFYGPVQRQRAKWFPWFVFWYRGTVRRRERPRHARQE